MVRHFLISRFVQETATNILDTVFVYLLALCSLNVLRQHGKAIWHFSLVLHKKGQGNQNYLWTFLGLF